MHVPFRQVLLSSLCSGIFFIWSYSYLSILSHTERWYLSIHEGLSHDLLNVATTRYTFHPITPWYCQGTDDFQYKNAIKC